MNPESNDQGSQFQGLGRPLNQEFSESHYAFLSSLIESKSARELFEDIAQTDFSHQCILEFGSLLKTAFDKNAMLARNDNLQIRIIDFELMLNFMVIPCHESDISNPKFLTFQENIRQMFKDFVSRSEFGDERARLLKQEYQYTTPTNQPQQQSGQPQTFQPQQQSGQPQRGFFRR